MSIVTLGELRNRTVDRPTINHRISRLCFRYGEHLSISFMSSNIELQSELVARRTGLPRRMIIEDFNYINKTLRRILNESND